MADKEYGSRLTTFLTQGIRLRDRPKWGLYTSGDRVEGGVFHFDPTDSDSISAVDLVLSATSNPDWNTDSDSSASETGILELKWNIFSSDKPLRDKKDFLFEFTFPSVTNRSPPWQVWQRHELFEHSFRRPLPPTWDSGFTKIRYYLTADIMTTNRGIVKYTKQIKYRPSWNPDKEIPWMQYGCMLTGFMQSAHLLLAEDFESTLASHPEAVHIQFKFPKILIEDDRLSGFIQASLPSEIEHLTLRFISVDLTFRRGIRVLGAQDETETFSAYRPRRLAFGWPNATLRNRERVDIKTLVRPADRAPPFYAFKTFNVYVAGTMHVRAIFTGSSGKMYRLAKSDLPIEVTGRPRHAVE